MEFENLQNGSALQIDELSTSLVSQARQKTAAMRTAPGLPKDKKVSLLVTGGPLKGRTFPIEKPQVLIGRAQADIVIEDTQISRKHCVLEIHGFGGLLVDLDSVNGTFFNGKKIASCELAHLSEFQLGGTTLMLAVT
jgi:type III secretion system (T3SS) inner membrane Yop/YscD-like protein